MSRIKSLSDHSNSTQFFDINQISPNLRDEYDKIIYHIQHQLFFDPDLNHQHLMYLLDQRNAIENEFIIYLQDCISDLNIPNDIRDNLFSNLNKFSQHFIPINMYSHTNPFDFVDDDSDDDTYVANISIMDSNQDDTYEDLENEIVNENEMESDTTVFGDNEGNQDEHSNNSNNSND